MHGTSKNAMLLQSYNKKKKKNGNTVIVFLVHMLDLEVQLLLSCVCRVDEDDNSRMLLAGLTG